MVPSSLSHNPLFNHQSIGPPEVLFKAQGMTLEKELFDSRTTSAGTVYYVRKRTKGPRPIMIGVFHGLGMISAVSLVSRTCGSS